MKLYKCWVSGTEKEIETEEVSWSYEREAEAPDFQPEPESMAVEEKPTPENEMRKRYKKDAAEVKEKTTEQLAKSAPWLKHLDPKPKFKKPGFGCRGCLWFGVSCLGLACSCK